MRYTITILAILIFVPAMMLGQVDTDYTLESFSIDPWLSLNNDSIDKIEVDGDKLYVYRTKVSNTIVTCAVYHSDDVCSWDQGRKERDVYMVVEGKMTLVETQRPKYRTIKQSIEVQEEYWQ